jgi:hypothetical protein
MAGQKPDQAKYLLANLQQYFICSLIDKNPRTQVNISINNYII